jgi:hypothetical protein
MNNARTVVVGQFCLLLLLTGSFLAVVAYLGRPSLWSKMRQEAPQNYQQRMQLQAIYLRTLSRM